MEIQPGALAPRQGHQTAEVGGGNHTSALFFLHTFSILDLSVPSASPC